MSKKNILKNVIKFQINLLKNKLIFKKIKHLTVYIIINIKV